MPVNLRLAHASDTLLFVAVLVYSLAMVGFAAETALRRRSSPDARLLEAASERERVLVGVAAGAGSEAPPAKHPAADQHPLVDQSGGEGIGRVAVLLTVVGFGLHAASLVTRGAAVHRVPWGNMYEYSSAVALVAVGAFLVLLVRDRARYLGAFVLLLVVLLLGLAGTVLYAPAGPLVPALHSYWIAIHVAAAIISSGSFAVGAIVSASYLLRARYEREDSRGRLGRLLPASDVLDRLAYRIHAFAFPVWTFAIVAGAIWAEAAWGRYWGWDPKETWSFITWVVYAGYLHARTTAGWKGRKAAYVALLGFSALTIDYWVVNIFLVGLHSYAGA